MTGSLALAREFVIPLDVKGARRSALRVVLGQVVLAMLVSSALLLWVDARTGLSALLGGGIGAVASLGMITAMFAGSSAMDARGALVLRRTASGHHSAHR